MHALSMIAILFDFKYDAFNFLISSMEVDYFDGDYTSVGVSDFLNVREIFHGKTMKKPIGLEIFNRCQAMEGVKEKIEYLLKINLVIFASNVCDFLLRRSIISLRVRFKG